MTAPLQLLPCGEDAVLVQVPELGGGPTVLDLAAAVTRAVAAAEPASARCWTSSPPHGPSW